MSSIILGSVATTININKQMKPTFHSKKIDIFKEMCKIYEECKMIN